MQLFEEDPAFSRQGKRSELNNRLFSSVGGAPFRGIFSTVSASNQLQFIWRGLINAVPSVVNRTDACPLSREKQRWRLGTDDVALWHLSDVTTGLLNVCCWGKSGSRDCVAGLPSL
jgi:hypothetical protein